MRILLLGGPFNFRTMEIAPDHVGSVYVPILLKLDMARVVEQEAQGLYDLTPDVELQVAEYMPGQDLVGHDSDRMLPVFYGRIYDYLTTK